MAWMEPLYERFGGLDAVARVVFGFYDRVLKSPELAPYFAGVDMRRLIDHQTRFLASVMGGPASYTDAHLREVHSRFKIDNRAFDEMIEILGDTLRTFGLAEVDVDFVLSELRGRRAHIVAVTKTEA
jgi:hemoglobin